MRSLRASFRSPRPHTHDSRKTPLRRRERLFGSGDDPASGRSAMQTQTDLNILSCREGPGRLLVPSGSATRIGGAWGAQGGLVPRRRPTPPCGQGSGRDKVGGRPAFPNSTQGMLAMFSGLNLSSSFIFSIVFLNKLSATRAVAGSARECGRSRPADADRSRRSHRCESRRRRRMRAAGGPRDDRTERIPLVESSPQRAQVGPLGRHRHWQDSIALHCGGRFLPRGRAAVARPAFTLHGRLSGTLPRLRQGLILHAPAARWLRARPRETLRITCRHGPSHASLAATRRERWFEGR